MNVFFGEATQVLKVDGLDNAIEHLLGHMERLNNGSILVDDQVVDSQTLVVHLNYFLPQVLREKLIHELRLNR